MSMKLSIVVLLACTLAYPAVAFADSVSLSPCGCGDDAPAIQQAIVAATQNGTVPGTVVLTGTFNLVQSVTVSTANVTLTASPSGASVIGPNITAFLLVPGSDGFTLSSLTVVARRGLFTPSGAGPVNNVTILGNTFDTVTRGVSQFVFGNAPSSGWVIRGNTFIATDTSGCTGPAGCAAILATGVAGVIENNSVQYNSLGLGVTVQNNHGFGNVTVNTGIGWSVQGNTVDADFAVWVNGGSSNHIAGNHFTQAGSYGVGVSPGLVGETFLGIVFNAEMNKITDNEIRNKAIAGIVLADDTDGNSVIRNTIVMSAGVGIDLGSDLNQVPGIQIGPTTDNQVHANVLASGDVGIDLRASSQENIVTGNQISTTSPPAQGILQESTTNNNLVRGNPGFDPITGSAKGAAGPLKMMGPGN